MKRDESKAQSETASSVAPVAGGTTPKRAVSGRKVDRSLAFCQRRCRFAVHCGVMRAASVRAACSSMVVSCTRSISQVCEHSCSHYRVDIGWMLRGLSDSRTRRFRWGTSTCSRERRNNNRRLHHHITRTMFGQANEHRLEAAVTALSITVRKRVTAQRMII